MIIRCILTALAMWIMLYAVAQSNNCGCNYMPLCNYDLTKSYSGKLYKGIRYDDESITYYNCDNGVLTAKFSITSYHTSHDEYKTFNYTRILLKENEKPGVEWIENARNMDGRLYRRFILSKAPEYTINGKTYQDVIWVRQIAQVATDYDRGEEETIKLINNYGTSLSDGYYFNGTRLNVVDICFGKGAGVVKTINSTKQYVDSLVRKYIGKAPLSIGETVDTTNGSAIGNVGDSDAAALKRLLTNSYNFKRNLIDNSKKTDAKLIGRWCNSTIFETSSCILFREDNSYSIVAISPGKLVGAKVVKEWEKGVWTVEGDNTLYLLSSLENQIEMIGELKSRAASKALNEVKAQLYQYKYKVEKGMESVTAEFPSDEKLGNHFSMLNVFYLTDETEFKRLANIVTNEK